MHFQFVLFAAIKAIKCMYDFAVQCTVLAHVSLNFAARLLPDSGWCHMRRLGLFPAAALPACLCRLHVMRSVEQAG